MGDIIDINHHLITERDKLINKQHEFIENILNELREAYDEIDGLKFNIKTVYNEIQKTIDGYYSCKH